MKVQPQPAFPRESLQALWRVADVMTMLRVSRPKVYALISKEGLPTVRFGRAIRIVPASFQQWLLERERTQ
jgi:excisionase family DNA binding protein